MVGIAWTLPSELEADSTAVLVSVDAQRTWSVAGTGPVDWTACQWIAPAVASESCYVAVVTYRAGEELGTGYGGPFRVGAPVAVASTSEQFGLQGARPNPFRAGGRIVFGARQGSAVTLQVFDLRGRLVETLVDGPVSAGQHEVGWDAKGVAAGVYFVQLRSGALLENRRLVVTR